MKKRYLFPLLLLPLVGGGIWWRAANAVKVDPAAAPRIVTVDRGTVKQVVMASGRISANYEVDIKCKASGIVIGLPYDVSDFVKKGSLVLELDPVDEMRRVEQTKAALAATEYRVNSAQNTLKVAEQTLVTDMRQAESALQTAEINARDLRSKARRTQQLFEVKLESQEQLETTETAAQRAELAVNDARNTIEALKTRPINIDMLRNEVKLAEIQVENARTDLLDAEQRLTDTKVLAPIDGVVTTRPTQIGSIVSSGITNVGGGSSIMTLSDLSRLFVLVPVDEADIGKVQRDQPVEISCDAFPDQKFEGKILRIAAKGLNTQNVVTFEVKIEVLGEGKELLKPEMSTDIEVVVAERKEALRVPSEAVRTREKDKKKYVLTPKEGSTTQPATATVVAATSAPATAPATQAVASTMPTTEKEIEIGVDDGTFCEIISGLKEGDKVVIESGAGQWTKAKTTAGNGT